MRSKARAEDKGMKINVEKTAMLAISAAKSFHPECYISVGGAGDELTSGSDSVGILGFIFSSSPTVTNHIEATIKKTRRRYWVLRHLKKFGFSEQELVEVYQSLVRSVTEYCSVVYHSLLTDEQAKALERTQFQALKCIYGYSINSYRQLLEKSGLQTLQERRLAAVDRFTDKCLQGRFAGWFPPNSAARETRGRRPYLEKYATCERLKNSPLYYMRRRLNQRVIESAEHIV
jgi:hypothetical protein